MFPPPSSGSNENEPDKVEEAIENQPIEPLEPLTQQYPSTPPPADPYAAPTQPSNPYAMPNQPDPYAPKQPSAPYTPLAGARSEPLPPVDPSLQQGNPYGQPQSNLYGAVPPVNSGNQPWPPAAGIGGGFGAFQVPVDGTRIMITGILSIFCFGFILGPVAVVQATSAINAINSGQADPSQLNNLKIGRVCGIIGTILWGLRILVAIFAFMHH